MLQLGHTLLQRLLIGFLYCVVQLGTSLGSDGVGGVRVRGFAVGFL